MRRHRRAVAAPQPHVVAGEREVGRRGERAVAAAKNRNAHWRVSRPLDAAEDFYRLVRVFTSSAGYPPKMLCPNPTISPRIAMAIPSATIARPLRKMQIARA